MTTSNSRKPTGNKKLPNPIYLPYQSRGLTHIRYSLDKDAAYGVSSDKTKGTCIHRLPAKGQAANSERCFEVGGKNTDVNVHRNQVVARGPSSVTVAPFHGEGKGVAHPLTSNARSVYLDKCDVLVTEKGDKCQIYSLKKGAFELVTSVDGSLATVSFGCNQESGNDKYIVATEVSGTSTIKVRRISLSSPSEAPKVLLNEVAKFSVGNIEQVIDSLCIGCIIIRNRFSLITSVSTPELSSRLLTFKSSWLVTKESPGSMKTPSLKLNKSNSSTTKVLKKKILTLTSKIWVYYSLAKSHFL